MSLKVKSGIHKAKDFFRKNEKKMYVNGLAALTSASLMTVSASAEGSLDTALSTATSLFSSIVGIIEGNTFLMVFLALGLIRAAFRTFRSARKSVG